MCWTKINLINWHLVVYNHIYLSIFYWNILAVWLFNNHFESIYVVVGRQINIGHRLIIRN